MGVGYRPAVPTRNSARAVRVSSSGDLGDSELMVGRFPTAAASSTRWRMALGLVCALPFLLVACGRSTAVHRPSTGGAPRSDVGIPLATGGVVYGGGMDAAIVEGSGGAPSTGGAVGLGGSVGVGGGTSTGGDIADGATGIVDSATDSATSIVDTGTDSAPGTGGSGAVVFPERFVGNAVNYTGLPNDFALYWNQMTPETAGRWGAVQGISQDLFNWATLDALYAYADEHHILFKEHPFLWEGSEPSWRNTLDATTAPIAVKAWMKAFCDRYPKTRLIDVVNEPPPHTSLKYRDAIGGGSGTTWQWVANAFTWAREACPGAVLLLNDYDNLETSTGLQNTIAIVNAIQKLNAPIDAIGCQAHGMEKLRASNMKINIDKMVAATGLPIFITEFDIGLSDEEQRRLYAEFIPMFWNHPKVMGITLFGYIVGTTWRPNTGLMTTDGTMRPAMTWLMDFLGRP
jgi:endo-1,4-beta-xylanase